MCGDAGDILTLVPLLTVLERGQSALAARLQTATEEKLAREVQSFLGTTTLGQSEFLRQLAGKDDKVI